jgi:hypothetical protein
MTLLKDLEKEHGSELALVILILRTFLGKGTVSEIEDYVAERRIDWDQFYRIISAHQLRPHVYKVLSDAQWVDKSMLQRLRNDSLVIGAANLEKVNELLRLYFRFKDCGIGVIPYKGVLLSELLYDDFVSRETADIDFLIRAADLPRIRKLLFEENYSTDYYFREDLESPITKYSCENLFYKQGTGKKRLQVEVHWELLPYMLHAHLKNEYLFQNRKPLVILNKEVSVLTHEAHLLSLLVHHGINDIWQSLRHVLDISVYIQRHNDVIDWESVNTSLDKFRIRQASETGFALAQMLFGIEPPVKISAEARQHCETVEKYLLFYPLIGKNKLSLKNFRQQVRLRDNLQDRIAMTCKYFLTSFIPNSRDMEFIKLPKGLFLLYYIIKPLRLLRNKITNQR